MNNCQIINYEGERNNSLKRIKAPQANRLHSAELLQIEGNTSEDQTNSFAYKAFGSIATLVYAYFFPKKQNDRSLTQQPDDP